MKYSITFILLLCAALCQAQGPKFAAFQKQFLVQYCECLQENPALPAKTILYSKTDTCVRKIMLANQEEMINLVDEFKFEENLSEYDKGRKIGKLIIFEGIDELVKDCSFYVASMKGYINEEKIKSGVTSEKIDTSLTAFKNMEIHAKNDEQRKMVYLLLAFTYYMKESYLDALSYFEKANAILPSTFNRGFIELIKQYDLKEKH